MRDTNKQACAFEVTRYNPASFRRVRRHLETWAGSRLRPPWLSVQTAGLDIPFLLEKPGRAPGREANSKWQAAGLCCFPSRTGSRVLLGSPGVLVRDGGQRTKVENQSRITASPFQRLVFCQVPLTDGRELCFTGSCVLSKAACSRPLGQGHGQAFRGFRADMCR